MRYGYGASGPGESGSTYLRGIEVLIAEDSDLSRKILRDILKILGADRLHYAQNGMEALDIARSSAIDLALIDWHMPVLDGLEFVKTVRTAEDSPNVFMPIIMISANSELHHVTAARDAGVTEYLIKPYSVRQLFQRIQMTIERPRAFIKTEGFFGPDRRRRKDTDYKGPERRKEAEQPPEAEEGDSES